MRRCLCAPSPVIQCDMSAHVSHNFRISFVGALAALPRALYSLPLVLRAVPGCGRRYRTGTDINGY
jgi:hypothetical protein